jgi:hypothetical protein
VNLRDANLQDLLSAYYEGTRAAKAAAHLKKKIERAERAYLANLLRDYRERAIDDPAEIRLRASVDDLMICCDVLEIASLAGFIHPPDDSPLWTTLRVVLANEQVQDYYTEFYPQKLPQLLHRRLEGKHTKVEDDPEVGSFLIQFLALDRRFMATLNDGYLLRMLDSFVIDGVTFDDLVEIVAEPEEYIGRILLPPKKRGVEDEGLHELSLFMQFSSGLYDLLRRMENHPLLQSEVWSHYGYWYGIIGQELNDQLASALNQFLKWEPNGERSDAAMEIQREVGRAKGVLKELTSTVYSRPVDRLVAS